MKSNKALLTTLKMAALTMLIIGSLCITKNARAAGGSSIQVFGAGWDTSSSGRTTGFGIKGSLGSEIALDVGWTSFGEGDNVVITIGDGSSDSSSDDTTTTTTSNVGIETSDGTTTITLGGVDVTIWDLGFRYTLATNFYLGAGLSYLDFGHSDATIDGEWGFYGVCGWTFGSQNLRGFIEATYRYAEGTIKYTHDLTVLDRDIDHNGFGANVGIMLCF